ACSERWESCSTSTTVVPDSGFAGLRRRGTAKKGCPRRPNRPQETLEILGEPKQTMDMAGGKSAGRKGAAGYRVATYRTGKGPRAGVLIGDDVFDAEKLTGKAAYASVAGILADWKAADAALKKAAAGTAKSRAKGQPLAKTKLLAPLQPLTIFCAGA